MSIITIILQLLFGNLRTKAQQLPDVDAGKLDAFVIVASFEQTHRVQASLLVSLAWAESRFESDAQPACGVMQVFPHDINRPQSDCAVWRADLIEAVRAGVTEIEMLLADSRVRGNMYRALMYRACGNKFFEGTCSEDKKRWVEAAMTRWKWLSDSHEGSSS